MYAALAVASRLTVPFKDHSPQKRERESKRESREHFWNFSGRLIVDMFLARRSQELFVRHFILRAWAYSPATVDPICYLFHVLIHLIFLDLNTNSRQELQNLSSPMWDCRKLPSRHSFPLRVSSLWSVFQLRILWYISKGCQERCAEDHSMG